MQLEEEEAEADKLQTKFESLAEETQFKQEKLMKMFENF